MEPVLLQDLFAGWAAPERWRTASLNLNEVTRNGSAYSESRLSTVAEDILKHQRMVAQRLKKPIE